MSFPRYNYSGTGSSQQNRQNPNAGPNKQKPQHANRHSRKKIQPIKPPLPKLLCTTKKDLEIVLNNTSTQGFIIYEDKNTLEKIYISSDECREKLHFCDHKQMFDIKGIRLKSNESLSQIIKEVLQINIQKIVMNEQRKRWVYSLDCFAHISLYADSRFRKSVTYVEIDTQDLLSMLIGRCRNRVEYLRYKLLPAERMEFKLDAYQQKHPHFNSSSNRSKQNNKKTPMSFGIVCWDEMLSIDTTKEDFEMQLNDPSAQGFIYFPDHPGQMCVSIDECRERLRHYNNLKKYFYVHGVKIDNNKSLSTKVTDLTKFHSLQFCMDEQRKKWILKFLLSPSDDISQYTNHPFRKRESFFEIDVIDLFPFLIKKLGGFKLSYSFFPEVTELEFKSKQKSEPKTQLISETNSTAYPLHHFFSLTNTSVNTHSKQIQAMNDEQPGAPLSRYTPSMHEEDKPDAVTGEAKPVTDDEQPDAVIDEDQPGSVGVNRAGPH